MNLDTVARLGQNKTDFIGDWGLFWPSCTNASMIKITIMSIWHAPPDVTQNRINSTEGSYFSGCV